MTTNFKRVRKLPFQATNREIVDIVNQLTELAIQSGGPLTLGVAALTSASSPYTVTANDTLLLVDTTSGNVTINLPALASSDGRVLKIKRISIGDNIITIDANSTETIDGDLTQVIYAQHMGYELTGDAATEWKITGVMSG